MRMSRKDIGTDPGRRRLLLGGGAALIALGVG